MRKSFVKALIELASEDSRVLLLTGDLGFSVLEPFSERFPERFFNMGVAEQNMLGVAAGLAQNGFVPFCYSIATFASLRGYEFFRNGAIHHKLPVRLVGVGGGFDYGLAGPTHHACEDIAVMRAQPELTVLSPCDGAQAEAAMLETRKIHGPVYLRLGKDERNDLPECEKSFQLDAPKFVDSGGDTIIAVTGAIAAEAVEARQILRRRGVECSLLFVSTLNPIERAPFVTALRRFKHVVTVEAHYVSGGLGSLVAEIIAEEELAVKLTRAAISSGPLPLSGSSAYLSAQHGLTAEGIAEKIAGSL